MPAPVRFERRRSWTVDPATGSTVDVLIPCYNYGRFLEASVGSVLQPDGPPVRVLIIDDCSTDDTPAIAAALAARHPNVSYRRHEKNAGHHNTILDNRFRPIRH